MTPNPDPNPNPNPDPDPDPNPNPKQELAERGPLGPALGTLIELITDALDINHDGVITKAELRKCASSVSDVQVAGVGRE